MEISLARVAQGVRRPLVWQWSRLPQLPPQDLYAAMVLRQRVFIVEQACAFVDADGLDVDAWHLFGWTGTGTDRELSAYLRLIDAGVKYPEPSIGRVVTTPAHRRTGLGRALMIEGLARAAKLWPQCAIRIGAQQRLEGFYAELGFRSVSDSYLEDGISHVEMLRIPVAPHPEPAPK